MAIDGRAIKVRTLQCVELLCREVEGRPKLVLGRKRGEIWGMDKCVVAAMSEIVGS
jgi:hypothetical protein